MSSDHPMLGSCIDCGLYFESKKIFKGNLKLSPVLVSIIKLKYNDIMQAISSWKHLFKKWICLETKPTQQNQTPWFLSHSVHFPTVSRQNSYYILQHSSQCFPKRPVIAMNPSGNMYPEYNLISASEVDLVTWENVWQKLKHDTIMALLTLTFKAPQRTFKKVWEMPGLILSIIKSTIWTVAQISLRHIPWGICFTV